MKLVKKLSIIALTGLALGGTVIVNLDSPAKTQTVKAEKVPKWILRKYGRTRKTVPTKQYNHYIKLANRKGTHYFKIDHFMRDWHLDNFVTYSMHGKRLETLNGSAGLPVGDDIIGTKTIGSKHYFITCDGEVVCLIHPNYFYAPTVYRVKKSQTIKTYDLPDEDYYYGYRETWDRSIGKFLVANSNVAGGRRLYDGTAYRAIIYHDGFSGFIKESDMGKLDKFKTDPDKYEVR